MPGKIAVMVLSCYSNDMDVLRLILDCAFEGFPPPASYSVVLEENVFTSFVVVKHSEV